MKRDQLLQYISEMIQPLTANLRKEKDDLKEEVIRLKARSHELGHVNKEEDKKREEEPITF